MKTWNALPLTSLKSASHFNPRQCLQVLALKMDSRTQSVYSGRGVFLFSSSLDAPWLWLHFRLYRLVILDPVVHLTAKTAEYDRALVPQPPARHGHVHKWIQMFWSEAELTLEPREPLLGWSLSMRFHQDVINTLSPFSEAVYKLFKTFACHE